MDHIDNDILKALTANGRVTASELGRQVNLSVPAVSERIRKLEELGIIEQYTVRLNREKLGYFLTAMVMVGLERSASIPRFRRDVVQFDEVVECYHIAGEYDYMLKIVAKSTTELEEFLSYRLKSAEGVARTNTIMVLSTLKAAGQR